MMMMMIWDDVLVKAPAGGRARFFHFSRVIGEQKGREKSWRKKDREEEEVVVMEEEEEAEEEEEEQRRGWGGRGGGVPVEILLKGWKIE
jgi:hypothetical protein